MDFSILCGLFLDYNLYLWTDLILIIMINRRDFLKNASLFTLGGLMAGKVGSADAAKPVTSETMAAKTVGLQIYSLGKELYADVPGGLKKIKQMGYTNLELAGYKEGKIGGVDIREIPHADLMKMVAFVFQDPKLFKDTLLENIRAGRPSATREEVLQAAHLAQCDDILEKFPDGIDTVVGSKGVYLSGGETQRIGQGDLERRPHRGLRRGHRLR